ncbi:hypothetical protein BC628DRAFT_625200 [Trametes gibbosa]|nr:hypothetical protein BC628DRAFT_625200 [Trametes gibbosa]
MDVQIEGQLGGCQWGEAEKRANALLPFISRLMQLIVNEEGQQHRAYAKRPTLLSGRPASSFTRSDWSRRAAIVGDSTRLS